MQRPAQRLRLRSDMLVDSLDSKVVSVVSAGPRERLALHGSAALSDAELLALLLGTGTQSLPVSQLAARILEQVEHLHGLARLSSAELTALPGVGPTKAARLCAAIELGARVASRPLDRRRPIAGSRDVWEALRTRFVSEAREHFLAIPLSARNQPLAELTVAIGGLTACAITPADVFRPVLREGAVSVIFAHNHPSGEPRPSAADVAITERLCRAGRVLGVSVFDHLVLGRDDYYSFADTGLLAEVQRQIALTGCP